MSQDRPSALAEWIHPGSVAGGWADLHRRIPFPFAGLKTSSKRAVKARARVCHPIMMSVGVGLVVVTVAMTAYLHTLAPTISWRNDGSDSGDLASAVATLGIPHPPGYPTYVLLGHAWAALPLGGDLAYRLNLFSAVGAALGAALTAVTVLRIGREIGLVGWMLSAGAVFGGMSLALAPLTWSQATIAEVYAPGLVFLTLVSLLVLAWREPLRARSLGLAAFLGGL